MDTPLPGALAARTLAAHPRHRPRQQTDRRPADARAARIEFNIRFSYPFACLVLMLIGVPLGLSSKRGGKSTGFVLTLLLVFSYYLLSNVRRRLRKVRQALPAARRLGREPHLRRLRLHPAAAACRRRHPAQPLHHRRRDAGKKLSRSLRGASCRPSAQYFAAAPDASAITALRRRCRDALPGSTRPSSARPCSANAAASSKTSFPLLLDEYVMRSYAANFLLSLGAFAMLYHRLHLLRADRRHHPQPDALRHRRRVSVQPRPLHRLYRHAALLAARRAHHLRLAQPHLRAHRHEGHRHLALSRRRAHPRARRHPGRRALRLRRVLPARRQPPPGSSSAP